MLLEKLSSGSCMYVQYSWNSFKFGIGVSSDALILHQITSHHFHFSPPLLFFSLAHRWKCIFILLFSGFTNMNVVFWVEKGVVGGRSWSCWTFLCNIWRFKTLIVASWCLCTTVRVRRQVTRNFVDRWLGAWSLERNFCSSWVTDSANAWVGKFWNQRAVNTSGMWFLCQK